MPINERTPLKAEDDINKNDNDARVQYLKSCYEGNVYTRIATTNDGALFQGLFISFLQVFVPIRILLDNRQNYESCDVTDGVMLMNWDTVLIGTALIYLLWITILNDTMKSMRGMDFCLGLEKLPRKWAVYLGMFITPIANCSTG